MRAAIRMWLVCASISAMLSAHAEGKPGPDGIPTDDQKKATAAYVLSLQRDSGGFAEVKSEKVPATVPATFAAVHALKYYGGEVKDKKACGKFVLGCRNAEKKAYAPTPDGKPDPRTTALAALTLVELRGPGKGGVFRTINAPWGSYSMRTNPDGAVADKDTMDAVIDSLLHVTDAKTLEEYRLFGEVFRNASRYGSIRFFPKNDIINEFKKQANPDGTFGKADLIVRDTAAAVVAIVESGSEITKAEQVAKFLKDAQRPDGGWGKDKSDLETTCRVVHALALLKGECDVAACRKFVVKCRNEDGSYGPQPGQPGNVNSIYYAGAVLHRLGELAERKK